MTKISKNLIDSLSKLAKINLSVKEVERYAKDISSIVGYMDEIKKLNVDDIPETSRVSDDGNILRDDLVTESLSQSQVLKNSKNTHNGFFLVPQILKDD
jgi:aspartyl-tRNA(Asn)/glutamyl-tRNA(Gln) amidotransferase subunit C